MNPILENENLLYIQAMIDALPAKDQAGVRRAALELREFLARNNDHGKLALAWLVAEMQAED